MAGRSDDGILLASSFGCPLPATFTMKNILRALVLAPLFHLLPALAASSEPLPHAACPLQGGLKPVSVVAAPGPWTRTVDTDVGKQEVSVALGTRIMLAFPDSDPFVNLKVERSVAGRYAADKAAILAQLRTIEGRAPAGAGESRRGTEQGIEIVTLLDRRLRPGAIDMVVWFDDASGVVVTAYLLNQKPERRAFQSFEEYAVLRERFIGDVTTCMAAIRDAGAPAPGK